MISEDDGLPVIRKVAPPTEDRLFVACDPQTCRGAGPLKAGGFLKFWRDCKCVCAAQALSAKA